MAPSGNFDIWKYLRLIDDRRLLFLFVSLGVMTVATIVCYILPKQYEAKSTVFIEQNVISSLVQGIAVTPSMEAKIRVLKIAMLSRNMLLKVIDELDLDLRSQSAVNKEKLITRLQNTTNVSLNEARGVFTISYTDPDPIMARNYVNTLVRKYIEDNTASKREESVSATRFLAEQIAHFRERIEKIDAEIRQYKQDKSQFLSMDPGILRNEIARSEEKLQALGERRKLIEAQRNIMARSNVYIQDETIKTIPGAQENSSSIVSQLEAQLDALKSRYTDKHPSVVQLQAQIDKIKEKEKEKPEAPDDAAGTDAKAGPDDAKAKASAPPPPPPEPVKKSVENSPQFEVLQLELSSIQNEEKQLHGVIDRDNDLLRQIPVIRAGLDEIEQRKQNENSIYEQLMARYGKSEVSKQMELQDKAVNFRIIDAAITPTKPVSPNRVLIIAMGIAGGLGLAVGLVILLDYLDDRIRSPLDLKPLKLTIMAVVPAMNVPDEEKLSKVQLIPYLLGGLYFSVILAIFITELLGLNYMDKLAGVLPLQPLLQKAKAMFPGSV